MLVPYVSKKEEGQWVMRDYRELRHYVYDLRQRIWFVILLTVLLTASSGMVSYFFVTPIYQTQADLLVNPTNDSQENGNILSQGGIETSLKLMDTYRVVIESPRILQPVMEEVGFEGGYAQLLKKVRVQPVGSSQVLSIFVRDEDRQRAVEIANAIAQTFQQELPKLMKVENVSILTPASSDLYPDPVWPKPLLIMSASFLAGLVLSTGLILLKSYLSNTLETEMEVEEVLGLPVLGAVAVIHNSKGRPLSFQVTGENMLREEV